MKLKALRKKIEEERDTRNVDNESESEERNLGYFILYSNLRLLAMFNYHLLLNLYLVYILYTEYTMSILTIIVFISKQPYFSRKT